MTTRTRKSDAPPGSLEAVQAVPASDMERLRAVIEYVERAEKAAADGRRVRDIEIRRACQELGPSKVAAATGLTLGTVKAANKPGNDPQD